MLAFIFAVVSLSSIDPDPVVTPAAALHDRAAAATGFASDLGAPASKFTSDITVTPACTFGVAPLGSSFWNDAASLSRTFSEPTCSQVGPSVLSPAFGSSALWSPLGNGLVLLAPATLRSPGGTTASFQAPLPARFTTLTAPVLRGSNQSVGARAGAEPFAAHAPFVPSGVAARRH